MILCSVCVLILMNVCLIQLTPYSKCICIHKMNCSSVPCLLTISPEGLNNVTPGVALDKNTETVLLSTADVALGCSTSDLPRRWAGQGCLPGIVIFIKLAIFKYKVEINFVC